MEAITLMPISLNAEMMAHCWDMIVSASPTLTKWNLPPSEDMQFKVIKRKNRFAQHEVIGGAHRICVSSELVRRFETLVSCMVHEAIHVHQDQTDLPRADNKTFDRMADILCAELELDRGAF